MLGVLLTIFIVFNLTYLFLEMPVFSWGFTDWSALVIIW